MGGSFIIKDVKQFKYLMKTISYIVETDIQMKVVDATVFIITPQVNLKLNIYEAHGDDCVDLNIDLKHLLRHMRGFNNTDTLKIEYTYEEIKFILIKKRYTYTLANLIKDSESINTTPTFPKNNYYEMKGKVIADIFKTVLQSDENKMSVSLSENQVIFRGCGISSSTEIFKTIDYSGMNKSIDYKIKKFHLTSDICKLHLGDNQMVVFIENDMFRLYIKYKSI